MSGLECAEWVPDHATSILEKEFAYWQEALDQTWALPLRVGPPTRDTIADLMRAGKKYRAEMQFWQRLANDPAMEKVYEDLDTVGFDEHQLADFLDAAWMANMGDLRAFRERRNHTLKTVPEIGQKALELKEMIESLNSDLMPPSEPFSVLSLLQSAEDDDRKPWGWLGRRHIVGEKPKTRSEKRAEDIKLDKIVTIVHKDEFGKIEKMEFKDEFGEVVKIVTRDNASNIEFVEDDETYTPLPQRTEPYLWEGAPTVSNLLQAIADAAKDWTQEAERGYITDDANRGNPVLTAALQKDRSLLIPEYVRGFIAALREKDFIITPQSPMELTRAIRGTIRVVLGHTEQDKKAKPKHKKGEPKHQAEAVRMAVSRAIAS